MTTPTPSKKSFDAFSVEEKVADLTELRESVKATWQELQMTLQKEKDNVAAVQTCVATLNLAIAASLKRLNEIAENPSWVQKHNTTDSSSVIDELSQLNWELLRVAPFLATPKQNLLAILSTAGVVEAMNFDKRLVTNQHLGFLYHNISSVIVERLRVNKEQPNSPTVQAYDAIIQSFCPPLMVYFSKHLDELQRLRKDNDIIVPVLQHWRPASSMIRRFLLQSINEKFLIVFMENGAICFAQRVEFSGLYVNKDLYEWIVESKDLDCPLFAQAGKNLRVSAWTSLLKDITENVHNVHPQGVPDDIPILDGERIVICEKGEEELNLPKGKIFPLVSLQAKKKGDPLSESDVQVLQTRLSEALDSDIHAALQHLLGRGYKDETIKEIMLRYSMANASLDDSAPPTAGLN